MKNRSIDRPPGLRHGDRASAVRVTWAGLIGNLLLAGFKLMAGLLGHSEAVTADGVHSLSDLTTDLAILIGMRYWSKPPDEGHPYGYGRIETVVTAGIASALALAGLGLGYRAFVDLSSGVRRVPGWLPLAAALLSIVSKEVLYHWTVAVADRVGSSALKANAWHHRSDALSSIPVALAVGVAMWRPDWAFVDSVGAVVVSVFILATAWKLLRPELGKLADQGADQATIDRIVQAAKRVPGVRGVHLVRSRFVGSSLGVDLHVTVDPEMTVRAGHEIAEQVKRALVGLGGGLRVSDAVVHLEPDEPHED
ncbi:MAG: cation transporter [Deltaproteobacteria bacterium]|nr:cation transporter [Deltaproteobacteria bacterium]